MRKRILPKKPTVSAIVYMSQSLREKFNKYVSVQICAGAFIHDGHDELRFWLSVADGYGAYIDTWEVTVDTFNGLMSGDIPNEPNS